MISRRGKQEMVRLPLDADCSSISFSLSLFGENQSFHLTSFNWMNRLIPSLLGPDGDPRKTEGTVEDNLTQQLESFSIFHMGGAARLSPARLGGSSGFTLVELMVIVGLLMLLALAAGTSFETGAWLSQFRLKGSSRNMYMNIQKARTNAIKGGQSWAVIFDVANNSYSLCSDDGADDDWSTLADNTCPQAFAVSPDGGDTAYGHGNATIDPDGGTNWGGDEVTFESLPAAADNVLVFNSRGISRSMNDCCYLSNNQGDTYAVQVASTGIVRLWKWTGTGWE